MIKQHTLNIDENFKAVSLLDLDFTNDDMTEVTIKYSWKAINEDELEKLMIFFYNKVMDDNIKIVVRSDFSELNTEVKTAMLRATFKRIEYLLDETLLDALLLLTSVDPIVDQEAWQTTIFKDFVEFVDIKLVLAQELSKIMRDFVVYYMSLIAGITGNRVLHTSTFCELFIATRKGTDYFGELLTSFALSSMAPISGEELYTIQNRDAIYSSMVLAGGITNSLSFIQAQLEGAEQE
jgi:hypothetical protein